MTMVLIIGGMVVGALILVEWLGGKFLLKRWLGISPDRWSVLLKHGTRAYELIIGKVVVRGGIVDCISYKVGRRVYHVGVPDDYEEKYLDGRRLVCVDMGKAMAAPLEDKKVDYSVVAVPEEAVMDCEFKGEVKDNRGVDLVEEFVNSRVHVELARSIQGKGGTKWMMLIIGIAVGAGLVIAMGQFGFSPFGGGEVIPEGLPPDTDVPITMIRWWFV